MLYRRLPCSAGAGQELRAKAQELQALKGNAAAAPPHLARLAASITDEWERLYHVSLTDAQGEEDGIVYTTIMVCRKHLPARVQSAPFFPLLVKPESFVASLILPSRYWAPELLARWDLGLW